MGNQDTYNVFLRGSILGRFSRHLAKSAKIVLRSGSECTVPLTGPCFLGSTFAEGQGVIYHSGGEAPIAGLVDGQTYYVITSTDQFNLDGDTSFVKKQVIQLAESENEALAGISLNLNLR